MWVLFLPTAEFQFAWGLLTSHLVTTLLHAWEKFLPLSPLFFFRLDIWMENQSFTVLSQPDLLVCFLGQTIQAQLTHVPRIWIMSPITFLCVTRMSFRVIGKYLNVCCAYYGFWVVTVGTAPYLERDQQKWWSCPWGIFNQGETGQQV